MPADVEARKQALPAVQLYNLAADLGEEDNQQAARPEVVGHLTNAMQASVSAGRSNPGTPQKNDTAVDFRKPRPQ